MNSLIRAQQLLALGLLVILPYSLTHAQDAGDAITKTGNITEDLYLAGGRVEVLADVEGDVVAAGGGVSVGERVTGNVIVAGGTVDVRGKMLDDVLAAGGTVAINGQIGDDTIAAGFNVNLSPSSRIGGRAWLAGRKVVVAGRVAKGLRVVAGKTIISGDISGDTQLFSDKIEIDANARIRGNLSYKSPREATIDPGAQIDGNITREPFEPPQRMSSVAGAGPSIGFLAGLIVTSIVLFLYLPNFSVSAARTIESDSWKCLGLGLALLVTTPIVAIVLMITVIGIPLALILLASYFVFLLAGYLTGALYLGDIGIRWLHKGSERSKQWRVLSIVVALIVLAMVGLVPIVGGLVVFVVLLLGLGALNLRIYRVYTTPPPKRVKATPARRTKRR